MRIDAYATPANLMDRDLKGRTVIVIDVLRATSTIITALENGAREVIPVAEVEEAVRMSRHLGHNNVHLCGERANAPIPGFALSNSPREYTRVVVENYVLVMTTTNGTRAVLHAREAGTMIMGGLLNARAVARTAVEQGKDVVILCAGTDGRYSLDDVLCAGALIDRIAQKCSDAQLDDLSRTARVVYQHAHGDLLGALKGSRHFDALMQSGYADDVRFCLREDVMNAVPLYKDGSIRNYE